MELYRIFGTKSDKKMFTKAIVRKPGKFMINGITNANLGIPDYEKALEQHAAYVQALIDCGLEIVELLPDEQFPDSTFVEDIALLTPEIAVVTNPGAPSRKGEIRGMKSVLTAYYSFVGEIVQPGTLEAGDVMMVGSHFYIGLSERTNEMGARQLIDILNQFGMTGSMVKLNKVLHLKTGVSYLEHNNLLVFGEFFSAPEFRSFNKIEVPDQESYAANSLWTNKRVLVPSGFPITKEKILQAGYQVIELDVSEFQKLDGGLSCLSLRF